MTIDQAKQDIIGGSLMVIGGTIGMTVVAAIAFGCGVRWCYLEIRKVLEDVMA